MTLRKPSRFFVAGVLLRTNSDGTLGVMNLNEVPENKSSLLDRIKVVSESAGEGARAVRMSLSDARGEKELAYVALKDFGKFVYLAGTHVDKDFQGQKIGAALLKKTHAYLEENSKYGLVNRQISHANRAKDMYQTKGWIPVPESPNWFIYVPSALGDQSDGKTVLPDDLYRMVRRCMES